MLFLFFLKSDLKHFLRLSWLWSGSLCHRNSLKSNCTSFFTRLCLKDMFAFSLKHTSVAYCRSSCTRMILTSVLFSSWSPVVLPRKEMIYVQACKAQSVLCRELFYFIIEIYLTGEQISNRSCFEITET